MAIENICSVSAKIPQELYEQVLTYTKEKNISIASLIKTLLINEVNTSQQNQEQSGTYDILSQINTNLEKLTAILTDDSSSKIPETKQPTASLKKLCLGNKKRFSKISLPCP